MVCAVYHLIARLYRMLVWFEVEDTLIPELDGWAVLSRGFDPASGQSTVYAVCDVRSDDFAGLQTWKLNARDGMRDSE